MKLTFSKAVKAKKIEAAAEQNELVKTLKKIEKLVSELSFSDTLSTMDSDSISLVYNASCSEEDYAELGQAILKSTKSMKEWSCTTQFVKKEETIQIKFTTKISF